MPRVTAGKGRPSRVGLDAHLLSLTQSYRAAGINGYVYELLNRLPAHARGDPPLDFVAYLREPAFCAPAGLAVERSGWDTSNPSRRIAWEQSVLAAASRKLDLLHGMAFATPLAAACPTVVTVHDLSFLRFPAAFHRAKRAYLSAFTRLSAQRAARVIVGAESTRRDVIELCGVRPERVVTVPYGVSDAFTPGAATEAAEFRRRKGLPEQFILFLGTLEPRKNIGRLIDAYAALRQRERNAPLLVIAGGKGWLYESLFAQVERLGLEQSVLFTGYVPGDELVSWYRSALIFVFPSLFEGFGLPVLEALACGTPTITSNVSSLPEVAGDAALLVDPHSTEALANEMWRLLTDPELRADLSAAGVKQAAQFPWSRTAAETAAVYRDALKFGQGGQRRGA